MQVDGSTVDAIAARWFATRAGQPGLAYGVVADGELVHSGGLGERSTSQRPPDADTVFRIASMTKSFTAAVVLLLRDSAALTLDDPAGSYVPELAGLRLPAPDCPAVTIRQLLTMTAGFPSDDPWGDRQQGLDPAEFARLLADGEVRCAWAPGTRFEYSNLGYAILGRVIESVTGQDYARVVRERLLRPLGLGQTGYEALEVDPSQLARGYRRDATGGWLEVPADPYGAFAPMGGVFSCVRDLARWVAGFAAAFPARAEAPDDADAGHPVRRASRRDMQRAHVTIPVGGDGTVVRFGGPPRLSYGFGLFCEDDPSFGDIVQHSGGYPGYGSNMRWHPATGLGVIVLANGTYAPAGALAGELLTALLASAAATPRASACHISGPAPAPGGPWTETLTARDAVDGLLQHWNDEVASRLFAPNVDLDQPLADRQADIATLRERIGAFESDADRPAECDSPAHCRWWLTGPGGTVAVQIRLAPLREPLVQQLVVTVPPAPGSPLARGLATLTVLLGRDPEQWPDDVLAGLAVADGLRAAEVRRQLLIARAWAGGCVLDSYLAGNGDTAATVRLLGTTGRVELALQVTESGELVRAAIELGRVKT